jgi:hypothetical protein
MKKKDLIIKIESLECHNRQLIEHNQRLIKEKDSLIKAVGLLTLKQIGMRLIQ